MLHNTICWYLFAVNHLVFTLESGHKVETCNYVITGFNQFGCEAEMQCSPS